MNFLKKVALLSACCLGFSVSDAKVKIYENEDLTVTFAAKVAQGTDLAIDASLLNNTAVGGRGQKVDRSLGLKSKWELVFNALHKEGLEAQVTMRSKFAWGAPKLYTGYSPIQYGDTVIGAHSHEIERLHMYLQEAWVTFDGDKLSGLNLWRHSATLGLFSFALGRGIALGDNYAVSPATLGFYMDKSVDQYAPGIKFSGGIYFDSLDYDVYLSIMRNRSTNLGQTGQQIYEQLIEDGAYLPNTQFARGAWDIDWRIAGRLRWTPVENKVEESKVYFEPYAMYTADPSQTIQFLSDAGSKMGTFGLAGEFQNGMLEFGFDTAFNCGAQNVRAFDRNHVVTQIDSTTGSLTQVFSDVYDDAAFTTPTIFPGDTTAYRPTGFLSSALNGQLIPGTTCYSSANRFRDPYSNKYKGFMFVMDTSLYVYKRDLKVSATAGYTSGDSNPQTRTGDKATPVRNYRGFVSQQELYAGERVKSFFVMGPASQLTRVSPLQEAYTLVTGVEGFSNLVFAGFGLTYAPREWATKVSINPNFLVYWQDYRSKQFANPTENASNQLGTEINAFGKVAISENLRLMAVAAMFVPGQYYADLKGSALNSQVAGLIDELEEDEIGGVAALLPTLGDNLAFAFSVGVEYTF